MFMIVALFVYGKSEQINEYKYKCMLKKSVLTVSRDFLANPRVSYVLIANLFNVVLLILTDMFGSAGVFTKQGGSTLVLGRSLVGNPLTDAIKINIDTA